VSRLGVLSERPSIVTKASAPAHCRNYYDFKDER
jgi:hypothetical protein